MVLENISRSAARFFCSRRDTIVTLQRTLQRALPFAPFTTQASLLAGSLLVNGLPITIDQEGHLIWGPRALEARREAIRSHQREIAPDRVNWIERNSFFYTWLKDTMRFIVEPNKRVLSVRCQTGFLLDAVRPLLGVGVEVSEHMLEVAKRKYPRHTFHQSDPEKLDLGETFDYILFDQISDTVDVQLALEAISRHCEPRTRLVLYSYNPLWRPFISLAEWLNIKVPSLNENWLSEYDLKNLLMLTGFQHLHTYHAILTPVPIALIGDILNRVAPAIPVMNRLCLVRIMVARIEPEPRLPEDVSVSVIVPCKNEVDNIELAVQRIPDMGNHTEIIFCDDKSTDGTADEVVRMQQLYPDRDIKLEHGPGISKSYNVWTGFEAAKGDILMILDADLAVMPEELPMFFTVIVSGKAELANGTRLIYPMPRASMKFFNMIGNAVFATLFSYLLNQPISDTLCGTKVIWREDWERMKQYLHTWGVEDRWGDYEILFGGARLHLKIVDVPVHYQERIYGASKMVKVVRNGLIMLRMCLAAFIHFKLRLVTELPVGSTERE